MTQKQHNLMMPQVAALAVVYHQQQLLLIQRKKPPQPLGWGFPGGRLHAGEALQDCATRELYEETGVIAEPQSMLHAIEVNELDAGGTHYHYILLPFLCRYQSGIASASDDALDCQWMDVQAVKRQSDQLIAHVGQVISQLRHHGNSELAICCNSIEMDSFVASLSTDCQQ